MRSELWVRILRPLHKEIKFACCTYMKYRRFILLMMTPIFWESFDQFNTCRTLPEFPLKLHTGRQLENMLHNLGRYNLGQIYVVMSVMKHLSSRATGGNTKAMNIIYYSQTPLQCTQNFCNNILHNIIRCLHKWMFKFQNRDRICSKWHKRTHGFHIIGVTQQ
jgi:hypothetical protein